MPHLTQKKGCLQGVERLGVWFYLYWLLTLGLGKNQLFSRASVSPGVTVLAFCDFLQHYRFQRLYGTPPGFSKQLPSLAEMQMAVEKDKIVKISSIYHTLV